jgi:hypothetical protein
MTKKISDNFRKSFIFLAKNLLVLSQLLLVVLIQQYDLLMFKELTFAVLSVISFSCASLVERCDDACGKLDYLNPFFLQPN